MLVMDPLLPKVDKVSIKEFNGKLGGLSTLQEKDRTGYTKEELKRNIAFKLCAEAAEKQFFEKSSGNILISIYFINI
jgi:ATP-dependent Zn protease